MKAKDLKFPLTIDWCNGSNQYLVTEGKVGLDWTLIEDGKLSTVYHDSASRESIAESLNEGDARLLPDFVEKKPAKDVLTISVDTSALDKALATAKELEATLLRIKGLLG